MLTSVLSQALGAAQSENETRTFYCVFCDQHFVCLLFQFHFDSVSNQVWLPWWKSWKHLLEIHSIELIHKKPESKPLHTFKYHTTTLTIRWAYLLAKWLGCRFFQQHIFALFFYLFHPCIFLATTLHNTYTYRQYILSELAVKNIEMWNLQVLFI